MIVKGSVKLPHEDGRFVLLEWGEAQDGKQWVMRLTASDGRVGREITVADIFRDAKMYECWPPKDLGVGK